MRRVGLGGVFGCKWLVLLGEDFLGSFEMRLGPVCPVLSTIATGSFYQTNYWWVRFFKSK